VVTRAGIDVDSKGKINDPFTVEKCMPASNIGYEYEWRRRVPWGARSGDVGRSWGEEARSRTPSVRVCSEKLYWWITNQPVKI
jgi:hypothetical protein